jgi:hypothetical protein
MVGIVLLQIIPIFTREVGWHPPMRPMGYPPGVTPPPGLVPHGVPYQAPYVSPLPPQVAAAAVGEWTEQQDAAGRTFYHNSHTKMSTWVQPAGYVEKVFFLSSSCMLLTCLFLAQAKEARARVLVSFILSIHLLVISSPRSQGRNRRDRVAEGHHD